LKNTISKSLEEEKYMVELILADINKIKSNTLVLLSNQLGIIDEKISDLFNCDISGISAKVAKTKKTELGDYYLTHFPESNKINNIYYAVISDIPNGTSSTHNYIIAFNKILLKNYNDKSDNVCAIMFPLNNFGINKSMLAIHISQIIRSFAGKIDIQLFFLNKEDYDVFNQFTF